MLLTTAKKLSPSLCNWRNLVCWGVNQLHYAFFCLSWALFFFLLPLFTFVGHAKKEGNLQHFETSGKSGCRFFCQSFSCTNYETPPQKKENKTMIIVGQLICIFAKTVDMAMHLSVKKLVRKWKVLLKRLKRNYFEVHFGRKLKWKIVFSMRIKCMSKTINGNWKWLSLLHLTMSRWINTIRGLFSRRNRVFCSTCLTFSKVPELRPAKQKTKKKAHKKSFSLDIKSRSHTRCCSMYMEADSKKS